MTALTDLKDSLAGAAHAQGASHAGDACPALRGYATTMAAYAGLVGLIAGGIRLTGRRVYRA
jgi:hypothetical protein